MAAMAGLDMNHVQKVGCAECCTWVRSLHLPKDTINTIVSQWEMYNVDSFELDKVGAMHARSLPCPD